MSWSDDKLSAYIDGELPAAEMAALERDLASDAGLAERLQRLSSANAAFVASISAIDATPVPASTRELLSAAGEQAGARVIAFRPRAIGAFVMQHRAIAASLVCAAIAYGAVATAPGGLQSGAPAATSVIAANTPLHRALERTPSGETVRIGGGVAVKPQLTFATADDAFCRQYQMTSGSGAMEAIACRNDEGWRVRVASFERSNPAAGDYQPAGSGRSPALEAFIDANIAGAPLAAADEAALLGREWTRR